MASTCYCEITFCNLFFIMKTMLIKKLHRTCGKGSVAVGGSGWQWLAAAGYWGRGFTLCPSRPYSLSSSLKEQIEFKQSPLFFPGI